MGKIKITSGSASDGEVNYHHLVSNHLLDPSKNIDKVIMYAEQRYLMTLLVSGATMSGQTVRGYTPSGGDSIKTYIPQVPQGELISGKAWSYHIMGRIQKATEIIGTAAVGAVVAATSSRGGSFKLYLKDNYIGMGMVATFPNMKQARVSTLPQGSEGKWLYSFDTFAGDTFSWDSWVNVMAGTKTVFGGWSAYGERSRRGFGNIHYPDRYVQHPTIQRKTIDLSGDVNAERVVWYEYNGEKGFAYEAEVQARQQFLLEDEFKSWWSKSNMRDTYGNLLARPYWQDEKGDDVMTGDGYVELIKGSNDSTTSGSQGKPTYDDFGDMMTTLKRKTNKIRGNQWIVITGPDGKASASRAIAKEHGQSIQVNVSGTDKKIGGPELAVGYDFSIMNVNGDQIIFVENPMMGDETKFPLRMANGELVMSNTFYFMNRDILDGGDNNVQIRARGRSGVNRNLVYLWQNGMTGEGTPDNPVDAKAFHMLKETFFAVKDTRAHGILTPDASLYS